MNTLNNILTAAASLGLVAAVGIAAHEYGFEAVTQMTEGGKVAAIIIGTVVLFTLKEVVKFNKLSIYN